MIVPLQHVRLFEEDRERPIVEFPPSGGQSISVLKFWTICDVSLKVKCAIFWWKQNSEWVKPAECGCIVRSFFSENWCDGLCVVKASWTGKPNEHLGQAPQMQISSMPIELVYKGTYVALALSWQLQLTQSNRSSQLAAPPRSFPSGPQ